MPTPASIPTAVLTPDKLATLVHPGSPWAIFMAAPRYDYDGLVAFHRAYQTVLPHAAIFNVSGDDLMFLCARLDQVDMAAYHALSVYQRLIVWRYQACLRVFLSIYHCPPVVRGALGV